MPLDYDVIVVGAGGSGLAAAWSVAQHGGRVLLLEKCPQPGGTTGIAVGSFTAAGTSLQRKAGIVDDSITHAEDAGKFAPPDIESKNNSSLRAFLVQEAAATYDWLEKLGLSFVGPNPEPPNRVPRMHNVVPGAKAYVAAFQLALAKAGATILCDTQVTALDIEGGRVVGVHATTNGEPREFRAERGVVLAAGDYSNNPEIIAEYKGDRFRPIEGINPDSHGDGHLLARDAGAELLNMDVTYGPELRFVASSRKPFQQWLPVGGIWSRLMAAIARRLPRSVMRTMIKRLLVTWQHPEDALFEHGAVLLNREGSRFVDERAWPEREIAVAAQTDKVAFILLDGRLVERYSAWPHFISTAPDIAYAYVRDYQKLRPDVTALGASLKEVAHQRGLNPMVVQQTVSAYNEYVSGKQKDPFGRAGDDQPLGGKPWVLLGPVKAYFTTTEGGARVDRQMHVLDQQGQTIPGLYAVGQNGLGGQILWGHGLHIAWALTSGRLAGQYVME